MFVLPSSSYVEASWIGNSIHLNQSMYLFNFCFGTVLHFIERPRIVSFKGPYKEEEQLFLGCNHVGGTPATNIKWLKNGRLIPHQTGSFYHINKLSASDSGAYACCAYYSHGNVSSPGVHVRVQCKYLFG